MCLALGLDRAGCRAGSRGHSWREGARVRGFVSYSLHTLSHVARFISRLRLLSPFFAAQDPTERARVIDGRACGRNHSAHPLLAHTRQ